MKRMVLIEETKKRGMTFTLLADQVGVSKFMISHVINCRHSPSWALQQRLVIFFGIPAETLLAITDCNGGVKQL